MPTERHALLFPGQGSQRKGMGYELYINSPTAKKLFDKADQLLGYSVSEICFVDPKDQLTGRNADTAIIQPALLTVSVATAQFMREQGVPPAAMHLGHSVGKYAALVAAGSLDFEQTLVFIAERGKLMRESKDLGAVVGVVIGLGSEIIRERLAQLGKRAGSFRLTVDNTPSVSLIGGLAHQWAVVSDSLSEAGAKVVKIYSEAPLSHHPMLRKVQRRLNKVKSLLLKDAEIPTIDDVSNQILQKGAEIDTSIRNHLITPISWRDNTANLKSAGINTSVETGPGNVLKKMMQREYPEIEVLSTDSWEDIVLVCQRLIP